jgi:hypothetical protein
MVLFTHICDGHASKIKDILNAWQNLTKLKIPTEEQFKSIISEYSVGYISKIVPIQVLNIEKVNYDCLKIPGINIFLNILIQLKF